MAAETALTAAAGAAHTERDFTFANLPEPWLMLPLLLLAGALAWWSWKRYGPAPAGMFGLSAKLCRATALVLLVFMAAGPSWRRTTTTTVPGSVLLAIDRSASMARTDTPDHQPRIASATQLATALTALAPTRGFSVSYVGLAAPGALTAADLAANPTKGISATGQTSPLGTDVDRVVAEHKPDVLLLVSDGRVTAGSALAQTANGWRGRDLRVAVLATGSARVEPELWIDEIVVNREAALNEIEPLTVRFSHRSLPAGSGPVKITVAMPGETPLRVETPAESGPDAALIVPTEAKLAPVFRREGPVTVTVTVTQGALSATQQLTVTVRERKLSVLLLANRPRYELRYLREALKRDRTITVHSYLGDSKWRRWGAGSTAESGSDQPLSPSQLAAYDVVILGDLGPDAFKASELAALDGAVRRGGLGLIWLPGETGASAGFARTKLGELLPAELPDAATIARGYRDAEPRKLTRTPVALAQGLLDPSADGEADRAWEQLPTLLGACPVLSVKPGADVLAQDQNGKPLVITRAYAGGHSLLIAVDDTWRWRRNVGDRYLHRFYSQLIRYVASGRRTAGTAWRLFANPRRADVGAMVQINVIPVQAAETPDAGGVDGVTVSLTGPGSPSERAHQLIRLPSDGSGFSLRLPAPAPGLWSIAAVSGVDPRQVDNGELLVLPATGEMKDPRVDLVGLAAFADATGGQVFTEVDKLIASLPADLRRSDSVTQTIGLWDTWWALLVLVALFALEWSIRRLNRLP